MEARGNRSLECGHDRQDRFQRGNIAIIISLRGGARLIL